MKRERTPVRLFVIAAAADAAYQAVLEKHLNPLWQQGLLANWQSMQPGEQVEEVFVQAKLILLLLSADFHADVWCQEHMQRALERQREGKVQVLPILLRPVEVSNAPFAHLAMVPTNRQAVTQWTNQDAAWVHIAEKIRCVLEGKPLPVVLEQKETARYAMENQMAQGPVMGEHNTVHQHFYPPPLAPVAAPAKPVWTVPDARNPLSQVGVAKEAASALNIRGFLTDQRSILALFFLLVLLMGSLFFWIHTSGSTPPITHSNLPSPIVKKVDQDFQFSCEGCQNLPITVTLTSLTISPEKQTMSVQIRYQNTTATRHYMYRSSDGGLTLKQQRGATITQNPSQLGQELAPYHQQFLTILFSTPAPYSFQTYRFSLILLLDTLPIRSSAITLTFPNNTQ